MKIAVLFLRHLPGADPGWFLRGVRFDQITVYTLRIRKGRPEQTVKTLIRRRRTRRLIRVYIVCHSSSNCNTFINSTINLLKKRVKRVRVWIFRVKTLSQIYQLYPNFPLKWNIEKKRKKYGSPIFSWWTYMKFQNISIHGSKLMLCTWKQQMAKKLQRAITPTKFH